MCVCFYTYIWYRARLEHSTCSEYNICGGRGGVGVCMIDMMEWAQSHNARFKTNSEQIYAMVLVSDGAAIAQCAHAQPHHHDTDPSRM